MSMQLDEVDMENNAAAQTYITTLAVALLDVS